jgi:hypothetical protein
MCNPLIIAPRLIKDSASSKCGDKLKVDTKRVLVLDTESLNKETAGGVKPIAWFK